MALCTKQLYPQLHHSGHQVALSTPRTSRAAAPLRLTTLTTALQLPPHQSPPAAATPAPTVKGKGCTQQKHATETRAVAHNGSVRGSHGEVMSTDQ